MFSGPAADGAQVAQVIAVESSDGSLQQFVDAETTCTVTGTSYETLQDAYPFIGAQGIAEKVAGEGAHWVDVPISAWEELADSGGGMEISLQSTMDVFDGEKLYTFKAGNTKVVGQELSAFLRGMAHVDKTERDSLRSQLGQISLARLHSIAEKPAEITSDLDK
ncbi:MAG: LCP family protein [Coriobacteriia bacterium]